MIVTSLMAAAAAVAVLDSTDMVRIHSHAQITSHYITLRCISLHYITLLLLFPLTFFVSEEGEGEVKLEEKKE